jgi:ribosome-interacting GTPase 1
MGHDQSIKETLNVIRRALEDDTIDSSEDESGKVLLLNQLVKGDGTINLIGENNLNKSEIIKVLNKKLDDTFDKYLIKWLDKNVPKYLEKYFKNKDF